MKKVKSRKQSPKTKRRVLGKKAKKKDFLKDVMQFRWLKRAMVGKTQEESLDLLDRWILKKETFSQYF